MQQQYTQQSEVQTQAIRTILQGRDDETSYNIHLPVLCKRKTSARFLDECHHFHYTVSQKNEIDIQNVNMHWLTQRTNRVTQNCGTLKLNVSLNEQFISQGRPFRPLICLAFCSLEVITTTILGKDTK